MAGKNEFRFTISEITRGTYRVDNAYDQKYDFYALAPVHLFGPASAQDPDGSLAIDSQLIDPVRDLPGTDEGFPDFID